MKEGWYVYILECSDLSLYTGCTTNVERRFKQHKDGTGSKYVRSRGAKEIVWTHWVENKSLAFKLEYRIKQLSRKEKLEIINTNSNIGD